MDARGIFNALISHAQGTGVFTNVNGHEPKSAPSLADQVNLALFGGPIVPVQSSGLNSVSVRWQIDGRVFMNAFSEPADDIDPEIAIATATYFAALVGDFTLGGLVRHIDVFGSDGEPMEATPGYMEQDKKVFRVMDLRIPLIINDLWEEVA
jgi:hypothetical protein